MLYTWSAGAGRNSSSGCMMMVMGVFALRSARGFLASLSSAVILATESLNPTPGCCSWLSPQDSSLSGSHMQLVLQEAKAVLVSLPFFPSTLAEHWEVEWLLVWILWLHKVWAEPPSQSLTRAEAAQGCPWCKHIPTHFPMSVLPLIHEGNSPWEIIWTARQSKIQTALSVDLWCTRS